ncbi:MAG: RHS repeat-associated core domain-containing protein [Comamonas sp.]
MAEYNPQNRYQPIRLPGQHEDEDTGLYYNRHRYYDSVVGRYINQDPIGLEGGVNISAYVNDPVSFFDAVGLNPDLDGLRKAGEPIKKAKETIEGAAKVNDGANKIRNARQIEADIGDFILAGAACKKTGEQMQEEQKNAKKKEIEGYKYVANGSVKIYKMHLAHWAAALQVLNRNLIKYLKTASLPPLILLFSLINDSYAKESNFVINDVSIEIPLECEVINFPKHILSCQNGNINSYLSFNTGDLFKDNILNSHRERYIQKINDKYLARLEVW